MTSVVTNTQEDPLVAFNFGLDIGGGIISGYFTEVSGLGSESETTEHTVVTEAGQQVVLKVPGRLKWQDITLKRGITSAMDIWEWRQQVEQGGVDEARKNGSIVMYDQSGNEVARWNFERGWPSKVSGPSLSSDGSSIVTEELTITHEYIVRVT